MATYNESMPFLMRICIDCSCEISPILGPHPALSTSEVGKEEVALLVLPLALFVQEVPELSRSNKHVLVRGGTMEAGASPCAL